MTITETLQQQEQTPFEATFAENENRIQLLIGPLGPNSRRSVPFVFETNETGGVPEAEDNDKNNLFIAEQLLSLGAYSIDPEDTDPAKLVRMYGAIIGEHTTETPDIDLIGKKIVIVESHLLSSEESGTPRVTLVAHRWFSSEMPIKELGRPAVEPAQEKLSNLIGCTAIKSEYDQRPRYFSRRKRL